MPLTVSVVGWKESEQATAAAAAAANRPGIRLIESSAYEVAPLAKSHEPCWLFREDDPGAHPSEPKSVVALKAIIGGEERDVPDKRIIKLNELDTLTGQRPVPFQAHIEITTTCISAGHEQAPGCRAIRRERDRHCRAQRDPIP